MNTTCFRRLLTCLFAISVVVALSGCPLRPTRLSHFPKLEKALRAMNIRSDVTGKVVLVEFWSRLCQHCEALIPELEALQEKYGDRGFVLISICQDGPESEPMVRDYLLSKGAHYAVIFDSGEISDEFRVQGLPALYLFDARERLIGSNLDASDLPALDKRIQEALAAAAAK